ncbi:hypothetical protein GCM10029964_081940 [Kibdelosporangium lantanae]
MGVQPVEGVRLDLDGLEFEVLPVDTGTAKFDLNLQVAEHFTDSTEPGGVRGTLEYSTDLFDAATAGALADRLRRVLDAVLADPDRPLSTVDVLADGERERLLNAWMGGRRADGVHDVLATIRAYAQHQPEHPAVEDSRGRTSYRALVDRAAAIAEQLRTRGVGRGALVGLQFDRGADMVAAVLALFELGAAYVPLDPAHRPRATPVCWSPTGSGCCSWTTRTRPGPPRSWPTQTVLLSPLWSVRAPVPAGLRWRPPPTWRTCCSRPGRRERPRARWCTTAGWSTT